MRDFCKMHTQIFGLSRTIVFKLRNGCTDTYELQTKIAHFLRTICEHCLPFWGKVWPVRMKCSFLRFNHTAVLNGLNVVHTCTCFIRQILRKDL